MIAILLVLGLVLLVAGAELLVRGAGRLAAAAGISPLVVGLTVVAFGTSAPELAVSVAATLAGQGDIALGNVVGSNIFNVLFILGFAAVVAPLVVSRQLIRSEVPLMVVLSVGLLGLALDGRIGRVDGVLLTTGIVLYTVLLIRNARRATAAAPPADLEHDVYAAPVPPPEDRDDGRRSTFVDILLIVAGLACLVLGSRWLVGGATTIAEALGLSDLVIGLTIVAAGTSLPELATSVVASLRGERDIAVGNIVGSNIFNILCILGVSSLIGGVPVSTAALTFDIPVMIAVAVACLPVFFTGHRIGRGEGALFLVYYAAYTGWLVLDATGHHSVAEFDTALLWFGLPLGAVTLAVFGARILRRS